MLGIGIAIGTMAGVYIAHLPVPTDYANIITAITGSGGIVVFLAFHGLIKDIIRFTNKPSLQYGNIIVKKTVSEQHDGEYQYSTYLFEIKNETSNSTAEDCRASVDLSSINLEQFYGVWEISTDPTIPIAHDASLKLFIESEFMKRNHSQSQHNIHFIIRSSGGDIINYEQPYDEELLQRKLKISIQSLNADFPRPSTRSVKEIINKAKKGD